LEKDRNSEPLVE